MKTKKWTKLVAVAMSCMMLVALTACGGGKSQSEGNALVIGSIGPITGPAAIYGTAVQNGAQLAVDEINASGDFDFEIEFIMQDDEHDAEKSVNAYNKLLDEGMQVLVGTVTTAPCIAVAAEAYESRVFALTPSASGPDVVQGNDNVYQLCFSDPNQGVAVADYIAENYKDAKVGIIYNNGDNYSSGIYAKFKEEAKAKGVNVVADATFASDDNQDFKTQLGIVKDAGADLLFLPIYYTPASNIMIQANDMGYKPTYFGVDGMDGILGLEGFDTSLAEGVMLLTPFTPYSEDKASKAFTEAYEKAYGELPIQFAADAYDCVYAVANAFKASGCTTEDDAATICEALIGVFNGDFTFSGITGDCKWSASGEVDKTPKVCVIEGGKYIEK